VTDDSNDIISSDSREVVKDRPYSSFKDTAEETGNSEDMGEGLKDLANIFVGVVGGRSGTLSHTMFIQSHKPGPALHHSA